MIRILAAVSLVAAPAAFAVLPSFAPTAPPTTCPNLIPREPLVLYAQSGGSLLGTVDRSLTVYNDGTARLTSFFGTFQVQDTVSKVAITYVGVDAVEAFVSDLSNLGAGVLCDEDSQAQDAVPHVVTILRNATDTRGHTFSFLGASGPYGAIQDRIEAFIAASFPGF